MSEAFIGEIRLFGFNFAPRNWALCNGQLIAISQNTALFSLLGTTYGGDGRTTFALPNLQSRTPLHQGQGPGLSDYRIGQSAGRESATLTASQIPAHSHPVNCQPEDGNQGTPAAGFPAPKAAGYSSTGGGTMSGQMTGSVGNNQPVDTLPPYLTLNFCICQFGIYPSRN